MPLPESYVPYADGVETPKSFKICKDAIGVIPAASSSHGHNFPVFDPYPLALRSGNGSKVTDVDNHSYIDYVLGFGPLILGHNNEAISRAVQEQLKLGVTFAAISEAEVELAKKVLAFAKKPKEMIVFSNTGAEATQYAMRFARAYTGKDKIIKFEGGYHGSYDYANLSNSGSPVASLGPYENPYVFRSSWGIPQSILETMITLPNNDQEVVEKAIKRRSNEIAAVIIEPVMMNYGAVPPDEGYLEFLRDITREHDILLIFDEVKTGFRLAPGGAQEFYGLLNDKAADITAYAKALGGGFPISAIVGKREVMELVVPGKVHHAGTYTGNPISLAASKATLDQLSANDFQAYRTLKRIGTRLQDGLAEEARRSKADAFVQGVGHGGFALYFTKGRMSKIGSYREYAQNIDTSTYNRFHKLLLRKGVYFHPQQYEQVFVSCAHTDDDVDLTLQAAKESFKELAA